MASANRSAGHEAALAVRYQPANKFRQVSRSGTIGALWCILLLVSACTFPDHPKATTSTSASPKVALTTNAKAAVVSVKHVPPPAPAPPYAKGLGEPYEISVSKPAAGSTISFPVDPTRDLAPIKGYRPSVRNLFVSVYEPALGLWVPLPTHYDSASHQLTVVAPHFSKYWKQVWNGIGDIGNVAKSAVSGVWAFERQIYDGVKDAALAAVVGEPQEHADCGQADPSYSVTASAFASKFPGCVSTNGGYATAHVENHLLLPYLVKLPTGVLGDLDAGSFHDLGDVLSAVQALSLGGAYLPPHGTTSLSMKDAAQRSWTGSLHLNWPAFAVNVAIGALSVIPADRELTTGLSISVRKEIIQVLTNDGVRSMSRLRTDIEPILKQTGLESSGLLSDLRNLTDFMDCADKAGAPAQSTRIDSIASWVTETVHSCLANFFEKSGAKFASDVTNAINGVFTDLGSLRALAQAAWNGPSSNIIGLTITNTTAQAGPAQDLKGVTVDSTLDVPPPPSGPYQGPPLTIDQNKDYVIAPTRDNPSSYEVARIGGATIGEVTGNPDGLYMNDMQAIPLPAGLPGGYDTCMRLPWHYPHTLGYGWAGTVETMPWSALWVGRQFCVQYTYSGLWISLLQVTSGPANGSVSFEVTTWGCDPTDPTESAIC